MASRQEKRVWRKECETQGERWVRGQCPSGFAQSGNYCLQMRRSAGAWGLLGEA